MKMSESMILFKGRRSLKQYNPMKPIKWGYKIWAQAHMDRYLSKFSIYQKIWKVTKIYLLHTGAYI